MFRARRAPLTPCGAPRVRSRFGYSDSAEMLLHCAGDVRAAAAQTAVLLLAALYIAHSTSLHHIAWL